MFEDTSTLSYPTFLENQWETIRNEVLKLDLSSYKNWPETFLYESSWSVFGLFGFGRKLNLNCQLCPTTAAIIEQVPGMMTAGFSRLASGTHIRPHRGYTKGVLRCHLGLIVPPTGRCELRVGSEIRSWQAGRCHVFDDTQEHEAWNEGATDRVILLLDVLRDPGGSAVHFPDFVRKAFEKTLVDG